MPSLPQAAASGGLREFQQAVLLARQNPQSAPLAVEAGALAEELNDHGQAMYWFRQAAALDPRLVSAITGQGQVWLAVGRPARAAAFYERALELAPDEQSLLLELARTYTALRDFPEALRYARRAEEKASEDPAVLRALAAIYGELVMTEECLKVARRACEIAAEDPDNWVLLGSQLLRGQKYGEAEDALRRALQLDPGNIPANLYCARALIEGKKTPEADREAFAMLTRVRVVEPNHSQALLMMGGILTRAGDFPLAISLLRRARESDPRDSAILIALGQALIRNRQGQEGVRLVTQGQKLGPRGVGFLDLEELVRKNPDPNLAIRLADLYRRQEMFDQAVHVLERALGRTPGHPQLRKRLASARSEADRLNPPGL